MCTLAVYHKHFQRAAVVIAANRDEYYDRPTAPPRLLAQSPKIFGGQDLVHGGTWLAINEHGVAAALLNRRSETAPDPRLKSRGLLCIDALRQESAHAAVEKLRTTRSEEYNPFNLLVVDAEEAWVLTNNGRELRAMTLSRGLHVISNLDVDDPECPRIATSTTRFATIGDGRTTMNAGALISQLRPILADHGTPADPRDAGPTSGLCVHFGNYGTRSSTLLSMDDRRAWTYFQAFGPPCQSDFEPVRLPKAFDGPDR